VYMLSLAAGNMHLEVMPSSRLCAAVNPVRVIDEMLSGHIPSGQYVNTVFRMFSQHDARCPALKFRLLRPSTQRRGVQCRVLAAHIVACQ
jgi:hypothetical protein